jgi:Family of unknown function (DUF5681)
MDGKDDGGDGDGSIGYGRPPMHTRFKPGQSGNVKGRPRGSKNLTTTMTKELNQKVTINENGRRKKITMREAIAKQALNKAAGGNSSLIRALLTLIPMFETRSEESQAVRSEPTPLPPGIVSLFHGAFAIVAEHGALPPGLMEAIRIADAAVPVKKEAVSTVLPRSAADANSIEAKKPEEDPPF